MAKTINLTNVSIYRNPRKNFGRIHVGGRSESEEKFKFAWAIQPPEDGSFFIDKCLLICTILSLCQNNYFKSERKDKTFLIIRNFHSKLKSYKNRALKQLQAELDKLFQVTKIKQTGPYQLESTVEILHSVYKCQFFIFSGCTGTKKLTYTYPEKYDDSLIPVFLYCSASDPGHILFISNIHSYFRSNYKICLECKKHFSKIISTHLCQKRPSCFACRRFFQTENTYCHEKLQKFFCDKFLTSDKPFSCNICNCTLYSKQCFRGHRIICNGKGRFGFWCEKCKKFTYSQQNLFSAKLREEHACSQQKLCKFCFTQSENENHLCKMKRTIVPRFHNQLIFFVLQIEENNGDLMPVLAMFNVEEVSRGNFVKYVVSADSQVEQTASESLYFNYFMAQTKNAEFQYLDKKRPKKVTQAFGTIQNKIKVGTSFEDKLIYFFISRKNCTFVCQDQDGKTLVSIDIISLYY